MLSAGGCTAALYSAAQAPDDRASRSGSSPNRRKQAGRGVGAVLPHYPMGPETVDAEAGYIRHVLLESLDAQLSVGLHVVCGQESNGARVEP